MSSLRFFHSTVNSGKTFQIMKVIHDYEINNEKKVFIAKPQIDSKGGNCIHSRVGNMSVEVDYLIDSANPEGILDAVRGQECDLIIVDEAQFISRETAWALLHIAHVFKIPVEAYGLRVAYDGEPFIGSQYLFALADEVIQMEPVLCRVDNNKKATKNLRLVNGEPTFEGDTIVIDGTTQSVEYIPVCSDTFIKLKTIAQFDKEGL